MTSLKRSAYAMSITPFGGDGRLDEDALRKHLARFRDAGVSVYVAGSVVGEAFELSPDEMDQLLAVSVEELKGHVQIRAMGTEPRSLKDTKAFLRHAERNGVDAAHLFSPEMGHGAKPSASELEAYFSSAIGETALPIVMSSYESMGFVLPIPVVERLADRFSNLVGIFYGGTDMSYLAQLISRLGGRLEIHCAGPSNALTTLSLGGNGFMAYEGNLAPALFPEIIDAFEKGDVERLVSSYSSLMAVHGLLKPYGGAANRALKPLLNALNLPGGGMRPPRLPVEDRDLSGLLDQVRSLKLPGLPDSKA